jgi:hypothetical protein
MTALVTFIGAPLITTPEMTTQLLVGAMVFLVTGGVLAGLLCLPMMRGLFPRR